jgi:multidrug efflux pump subunit AcrB
MTCTSRWSGHAAGLVGENAILIVEFAVMKVQEGYAPVAAVEAARLRFRPILMTSLALFWAWFRWRSGGAGAAARQSLGTGVLGGMLAATFLAISLSVVLQADPRSPL